MKERPILFSAPMVRALLAGAKTQTRRAMKRQPWAQPEETEDGRWQLFQGDEGFAPFDCPYGKPGDRLWVRETWRTAISLDDKSPSEVGELATKAGWSKPWAPIKYDAGGATDNADVLRDFGGAWGKTRVSIHMPRWASRISLEITGVRVERLQDISEADALAEGVACDGGEGGPYYFVRGVEYGGTSESAVLAYRRLWESINGAGSWALNPWVWAIELKVVERAGAAK